MEARKTQYNDRNWPEAGSHPRPPSSSNAHAELFGTQFEKEPPRSMRLHSHNSPSSFDFGSLALPDLNRHRRQDAWNHLQLLSPLSHITQSQFAEKGRQQQQQQQQQQQYQHQQYNLGYFKPFNDPTLVTRHGARYADSGYESRTSCGGDAQSVISSSYPLDSAAPSPSVASSCLYPRLGDVLITDNHVDSSYRMMLSGNVDTSEQQQRKSAKSLECKCGWVGNTPSEKRKHEARHRKEFTCEDPHCRASNIRFGTKNDLERHRKAVHGKTPRCGPSEVFKCFGKNCSAPEKEWPRMDNFKAHLKRKHGDESELELMRLSREWYERDKTRKSSTGEAAKLPPTAMTETCSNHVDEPTILDIDGAILNTEKLPPEEQKHSHIKSADNNDYDGDDVPPYHSQATVEPSDLLVNRKFQTSASNVKLPNLKSVLDSADNEDSISTSASPAFEDLDEKSGVLPNLKSFERGVALMRALTLQALENEEKVTSSDDKTKNNDDDKNKHALLNASGIANISTTAAHQSNNKIPNISGLSEKEKLFLFNVVSDMKLQLAQHVSSYEARSTENSPTDQSVPGGKKVWKKAGGYTCEECGPKKTFNRRCELKCENNHPYLSCFNIPREKHIARHKKPYGCTFPDCYSNFGSKADWKRHENTQHFHLQSFRCSLPRGEYQECAKLFLREEDYKIHLEKGHGVVNIQEIHHQMTLNCIGRNGQTQYWCGFCQKIKSLEKKGLEAWNERFDHIDNEHFKKGQTIENWLPANGHKLKGDLKKKHEREKLQNQQKGKQKGGKGASFHSQDGSESDRHEVDSLFDEVSSSAEDADSQCKRSGKRSSIETSDNDNGDSDCISNQNVLALDNNSDDSLSKQRSNKRKAGIHLSKEFEEGYKTRKFEKPGEEFYFFCCQCQFGPVLGWYTHCPGCNDHRFCYSCRTETQAS